MIFSEHTHLLAVIAFRNVFEYIVEVFEFEHWADRPKLFFPEYCGVAIDRIQDGGKHHVSFDLSASPVDDGGSLDKGFIDVGLHGFNFAHLREGSDVGIDEGAAHHQFVGCLGKGVEKFLADVFVDVHDFQGRAALPVEAPSAFDALFHSHVEVGVWEDNGWVFGLEPQDLTHAIGLGML